MGKIERESKKRARKAYIEHALLSSITLAGLLAVAIVAPNVVSTLADLGLKVPEKFNNKVNRTRNRLLKDGYLQLEVTPRGKFLRVTKKGESRLRKLELQDFKLKKPRKWDQKFRIITFDIKEERRYVREQIRNMLRRIGFYRLQQSVWVYPYDCEDVIMLLKADYKIGKEVLYVIADFIENDKAVREHFGLK